MWGASGEGERRRSRRRFFLRNSKDGNKAEALRGGSWNNNPRNARVSNRNRNEPGNRNNNIGLRSSGGCGQGLPNRQEARAGWDYGPAGRARPLPGFGPGEPSKRSAKHQPAPRPVVAPARGAKLGGEDIRKSGAIGLLEKAAMAEVDMGARWGWLSHSPDSGEKADAQEEIAYCQHGA